MISTVNEVPGIWSKNGAYKTSSVNKKNAGCMRCRQSGTKSGIIESVFLFQNSKHARSIVIFLFSLSLSVILSPHLSSAT